MFLIMVSAGQGGIRLQHRPLDGGHAIRGQSAQDFCRFIDSCVRDAGMHLSHCSVLQGGFDPCQQFVHGKRLSEIVVRAGVQSNVL